MAKITPKENFLKLRHGGTPEYVPFYSIMGSPYLGESACAGAMLPLYSSTQFMDGGKDMWGVPYAAASEGVASTMPDNRIVMLEDISDWSKVVEFPKANDVDLEKVYQETLKRVDRSQTCLKIGPSLQPFQQLVGFMGFEGALTALYTDPEECKALLNAMVDHLEPFFEPMAEVFQPDWWALTDDTCAATTPFFSPAIYEDVFKPIYTRLAASAQKRDIPVLFHNCGKIDEFIPFMIDFGVELTEPSQEINDLNALKEQFKGKISFAGGWGWGQHIPEGYPDNYDEEAFRQDIRDTIDKWSKGGAYAFAGFPVGVRGDTEVARITEIMRDEAHWYGRKVYGYTDD